MIATLGLVWGTTFFVTEIALRGISPFWLAAGRIAFAAALMAVVWGIRGFRLFTVPANSGTLATVFVVGIFSSAVPFCLLAWGQQYVTAGFAGVSMAAIALIVLPLAYLFVPGEQLGPRKVIGFFLGFAGVVVLIGADAFENTGAALEMPGRLACFGAASCYAMSSILVRRLPKVDPLGLATTLLIVGTMAAIPIAWFVEGPPPLPPQQTIIILALLGLIPTAAANLLRIMVIRSAGPVFMSLTNYQVPVWSVLMGALILNEPLPSSLLLALVLILSGVGLSQYSALKRVFGAR